MKSEGVRVCYSMGRKREREREDWAFSQWGILGGCGRDECV